MFGFEFRNRLIINVGEMILINLLDEFLFTIL